MTTTDARGKIIRVGDTVHRTSAARAIRKNTINGRFIPDMRTFRVRAVQPHGFVQIRKNTDKSRGTAHGSTLVKE